MKPRLLIGVITVMGVLIAVAILFAMQRSSFGVGFLQQFAPLALPSSTLAQNLESGDTDLVRESLGILADRRDPIAVQRALPLLQSQDDYIWLNAAHYLGAVGRAEAVPYLIKAFRHTAWLSDSERVRYLQSITGQSFTADFRVWSNWWATTYTNATFDFDGHLGPIPRR